MSESDQDETGAPPARESGPGGPTLAAVTADEYAASFGESLRRTLDLETWLPGEDLSRLYGRLADEVRAAVAAENGVLGTIRERLFPRLARYPGAPKGAGWYEASPADIERIHRGLLFNGGVEACDGTIQPFETLPLTIFQVGVSLVSYQGNQGTWSQRLYHRDLRLSGGDPVSTMIALLEEREKTADSRQPGRRDRLSVLAQRGILAYAERAILLRRSTAVWRMGHGSPAPYELVTGSGMLELMVESTSIIRELVEGQQKFVFVPSQSSDRLLWTIGQALRPLEFAIVSTLRDQLAATVERGHFRWTQRGELRWDGVKVTPEQWIRRFRDDVAAKVVVGVYRATLPGPAQVFYAHEDHAQLAAHVALADSVLQAHRGFPMLLDLAASVADRVFGRDTLAGPAATALADAGAPWRLVDARTGPA